MHWLETLWLWSWVSVGVWLLTLWGALLYG